MFSFAPVISRRLARLVVPLTALFAAGLASSCSRDAAGAKPAAAPAPKAAGAPADKNADAAKAAQAEKEKAEKARQAAADAVPVETALVARGPISAFLSFNSTLETEATVDLFPQTSGQVETLFVEEGKAVKEGEPLLKIEDRELRVDAEETASNYDHLKQAFARLQDLFDRNLVNKQEYDDNRFQLDQARLRNERAQLKLSYATVRAPFSGVISSRDTQVGARVGPGTKLFSMVKLDEIIVRVFVPGRYLPTVAEGQAAIVTPEAQPDRTFQGWVKRISPVIDPKSGTFKVTVGVRSDKPGAMAPGGFVGVRVVTDTRASALLIPKRAVVYEGGERYVFLVEKERAVKRKLTAGFEDPANIEALSGFEVGATVIVLGQAGLKDGAMVRAVNAPAASEAATTASPAASAKSGE